MTRLPQFIRGSRWFWLALALALLVAVPLAIVGGLRIWERLAGDLEPGPIVLASGTDVSLNRQRQQLIDKWNLEHPANPATMVELSQVADLQRSQMVTAAQQRSANYDVLNIDAQWTAEFARGDLLRPIDETRLDTGDYLDVALDGARYRDRLWGVPFNADAGLLYYRADLLRQYGIQPPDHWTWRAMNDTWVKIITFGRPEGLRSGIGLNMGAYEGRTINMLEQVWDAGGEVVRDPNIVTVDTEVASEGFRRIANGVEGGRYAFIDPRSRGWAEDNVVQSFNNGELLFMRGWPVAYPQVDKALGKDANGRSRVGVAALPGPSVLGGQNLAIAAGSQRPKAAQALIEFLTSAPAQRQLFFRGGLAPARESVLEDTEPSQVPYVNMLRLALETARNRPVTPYYPLFTRVMQEEGARLLSGDSDGADTPALAGRLKRVLQGG
ncbi:MAG: extracellular solute-binding protein [Streptosporangiales bacterium]|nr:extracellular solute-binding protein [Streptosporangiales bacterium]